MADLETQDVYSYIITEKNKWRTERVPLTNSKDWNMYEHIERCTNVSNGWYHSGKNDGTRPYDDIVTPVINVAFRSEGFDVKDIVPYVNDADNYYKSFLIKKFHPQWARKHQLDTFIDEIVESSIIYDLVLVKDVNNKRPEVVDLKSIAFCDQTDIMAGPIALKHDMTIADLVAWKGKWDDEAIERLIVLAEQKKTVALANDKETQTPGKYIEVYELRGNLPEKWIKEDADRYSYVPSMHVVAFYTDDKGGKAGITLYKGKDKPLNKVFKSLKIDQVRSKGRACGKSIVETLFEPQVWNNYAGIKIKEMLDSAVDLFVTDSEVIGNQKLSELKTNTMVKQEKGATTTRLNGSLQHLNEMQNYKNDNRASAQVLGSASDASLGRNPVSGTPFALQNLVVQEGQGIHEYRQGKISTFFADVLYPDLILKYIVDDMNKGTKFSEELSLDELEEIADTIAGNFTEQQKIEMVLSDQEITPEIVESLKSLKKEEFMKGGTRRFFETMKDEFKDIPVSVFVNIKGKQKRMAENADKITNVLREIIANPQAFSQIPGIGSAFNQLLEESGLNPIDFSKITKQTLADPLAEEPEAAPQPVV